MKSPGLLGDFFVMVPCLTEIAATSQPGWSEAQSGDDE